MCFIGGFPITEGDLVKKLYDRYIREYHEYLMKKRIELTSSPR